MNCIQVWSCELSCSVSGQEIPSIIQQVENDLNECLNYNLILLRDYLSSKSADEICALTSVETEVPMLLPCDLLLKLVAITILTSHSLRLQGMRFLEGIDGLIFIQVLLVIKSKLDCVLFDYATEPS